MKKIFLTLASIWLFQLATCLASEPDLPPLPAQEIKQEIHSLDNSKVEKSFWSKVLGFFGIGKEEKQEPVQDKPKQIEDASTSAPSLPKIPEIETTVSPASNEPSLSIIPKQVVDDNTKLELPSGFEPEKDEALATLPSQTTKVPEAISAETIQVTQIPTEKKEEIQKPIDQPKIITIPQQIATKNITPSEESKTMDSAFKPKEALLDDIKNVQTIKEDSEVLKYRKQLQQRLSQAQNVPEIPQADLGVNIPAAATTAVNNITSTNLEDDSNQIKFINNELQVLKLPNDDIVLGEITEEARLELIDFSSYVPIFWKNYNIIKNEPARKMIDDFILDYDSRIIKPTKIDISNAFIDAFKAIDSDSIYSLINLVEHYPILQMVDQNGNNLLHKAVYAQNYSAVKFLLMKGVNLSTRNDQGYNAADIALSLNNQSIILLLHTSGMK